MPELEHKLHSHPCKASFVKVEASVGNEQDPKNWNGNRKHMMNGEPQVPKLQTLFASRRIFYPCLREFVYLFLKNHIGLP